MDPPRAYAHGHGHSYASLTADVALARACAQGSAITFIHLIGNQMAAPQVKVGRRARRAFRAFARRVRREGGGGHASDF